MTRNTRTYISNTDITRLSVLAPKVLILVEVRCTLQINIMAHRCPTDVKCFLRCKVLTPIERSTNSGARW